MNNELNYLYKKLNTVYNEQPWYGDSITAVLKKITHTQAVTRPFEDANTIAGIVSHMLAWRLFSQKRLEGDVDFEIDNEASFQWKTHGTTSEVAWKNIIHKLDESQGLLLSLLSNFSEQRLDETVAGRPYTFRVLLEGIIEHDIYHLGQINLIRKHFT